MRPVGPPATGPPRQPSHPPSRHFAPNRSQQALLGDPVSGHVSPRSSNDSYAGPRGTSLGGSPVRTPLPSQPNLYTYTLDTSPPARHNPGTLPGGPVPFPPAPPSPTKDRKKGFHFFKRKKNRDQDQPPPRQPPFREKRSGSDGGNGSWGLGHLVASLSRPPTDTPGGANGDLRLDTNVDDMDGIVNMEKAASLKDFGENYHYSRRGSQQRSLYDDHSDRDSLYEAHRIQPSLPVARSSLSLSGQPAALPAPTPDAANTSPHLPPLPNQLPSGSQSAALTSSRPGGDVESPEVWAPPDSWAVLPDEETRPARELGEEDYSEDEGDVEDDGTPYYLRIYRKDTTFCTVACRLNTVSADIIQMAAKKFYMDDVDKYCLYVKKANSAERTVGANERPVLLLRRYMELMGYTREDNLSAHMREDNTYFCQFTLIEAAIPSVSAELDHIIHSPKQIDLKAVRLQTIPVSLYHEPSKIMYLNLSKNLKIDLPSDFTQLCTNLRELRLATCQYRRVPAGVHLISSLMYLDLSGNELKDLDSSRLEDLRNLQHLLVRNNRLVRLPPGFARFRSLKHLTLSNNNFAEFPAVLCEVRTLTQLDLSFNFIPTVPEAIGQLSELRNLSLLCNRLTGALPATFRRLRRLEKLDLRRNHIQDIQVLSNLPRLQGLFCDHNALSRLEGDFQALKNVSLAKSYLTSFSLRDAAASLVHLKLSHCQLAELPGDLFVHLPALRHLEINNNHLTALPRSLGRLNHLAYLSCTNNNLSTLPVDVAHLPNLEVLDVHSNNLKALCAEIWLAPRLRKLNLSSNLLEFFPHPSQAERSRSAAAALPSATAASYRKGSLDETNGTDGSQGAIAQAQPLTSTAAGPGPKDEANVLPPPVARSQSTFTGEGEGTTNISHVSRQSLAGTAPALCRNLRDLRLGGNFFNEELFHPLAYLEGLRILNLSFNEQIYEVPAGSFCHHANLVELYLSGTQIATLPGEDMVYLRSLRVLHVNANKLQTLPAELGKIGRLAVLDAGSNMLRYNISNWPYDWNWNWNLDLQYLNLSNNKRLEIKRSHIDMAPNKHNRDLANFGALTNLRVLGLMDVTMVVSPPDQTPSRRIRTSASMVDSIHYGMADMLEPDKNLTLWDFVIPRFRGAVDEALFGLFDSHSSGSAGGSRLFEHMNDKAPTVLKAEMDKLGPQESPRTALRRAFLALNKQLSTLNADGDHKLGASALVAYFIGTTVYLANVGNILAVVSRKGTAQLVATKHTPADAAEVTRIRSAGGYISQEGLVQGELEVTRSFGYFHLLPYVNANPSIEALEVSEEDEFIIIASRGLWEHMSYQMAVDVARTQRHDVNLAAQKLRDYAISYGADRSLMVMVLGLRELFGRSSALRNRSVRSRALPTNWGKFSLGDFKDEAPAGRLRRGAKEELPADSTLARLDREVEPPTGELALVFTDIKSSTALWETIPIAMRSAIRVHNSIMRRLLRTIGGYEVKTEGDAFMVSFPTVASALHWCLSVQLQLLRADWPQEILDSPDGKEVYSPSDPTQLVYRGLWVRMGVHWGRPVCEEDPITRRMDYFGPMVNRSARICNAADGGQIYVSQDVVNEIITIKEMLDSDANFITTPGGKIPVQGSHSSSAASATSVAALAASTAHDGGNPVNLEQLAKDIQALKKLGLNIVHIGEHRLKGLEFPETLALAYPKDLAGRLELQRLKESAAAAAAEANTASATTSAATTPQVDSPAEMGASSATTTTAAIAAASIPATPPQPSRETSLGSSLTPATMLASSATTPVRGGSTTASPALNASRDPMDLVPITEFPHPSPPSGPRIIVRPPATERRGSIPSNHGSPDLTAFRLSAAAAPINPLPLSRSLSNYQIAPPPPGTVAGGIGGTGIGNNTFGPTSTVIANSHRYVNRESLWHLEQLCLRLERLSKFFVHRGTPYTPFRFGPGSTVSDMDYLVVADNLLTRVENAARSLYLEQLRDVTTVLEEVPAVFSQQPEYLKAAIDLFMNLVQADPGKFIRDFGPGETVQVVEESALEGLGTGEQDGKEEEGEGWSECDGVD
ncbi:cysteinyl-tRNA synthetase [Tieghemiomyces parasiticus]|uniref:Adenylate cyclase n=1 Tax=Tieghemiomyces parasiticus TaxID=78921 RepID=A0A9W7ZLI4_9FUNG|nr:cysteinyl-tRNA synthetase [Tieghemiomyces parasiticus]